MRTDTGAASFQRCRGSASTLRVWHYDAGAAADVTFRVHTDRAAYTGRALRRIVEPGELRIQVGTSAGDLPCEGSVELTGKVREAGAGHRLVTPVEVRPADS